MLLVMGFVFFGGINSSGMAGLFKVGLIFATIFVGGYLAFTDMGGLSGMHELFRNCHGSVCLALAPTMRCLICFR